MGSSGGNNSDALIAEQRRLKQEEETRAAIEQSRNDLTSSQLAKRVLKTTNELTARASADLTQDFTGV